MRNQITALLLLTTLLFSCQHEPEDIIDPSPQVTDRPVKLVQVDADDDSIVFSLKWNASGQFDVITFKLFIDGIPALTGTQTQSYYSTGNLNSVHGSFVDPATGQMVIGDEYFFQTGNRIVGARYADPTSPGDMLYDKYEYDSKGHISIIAEELDSITYFTSNKANYEYYDSLVYDDKNRMTERYEKYKSLTTNLYEINRTEHLTGYDNNPSYFPGGINGYLLFGDKLLLSSNNPGRIDYTDEFGGPSTIVGSIIWTNIYDAKNRPVKLSYSDTDNIGDEDHGSRLIYY